ncbi:N-acetyltransferase domain-containing protein OS=Tsukamurella paurometabola (strain ATCC 8368 / DSM / CCUG 35730 / CIP 100753 / JCM 10117 / KCTC 9821 /NBRC 16120 / NCIMB 702349 / NCTC 13040) OX=521096 GN=Tpau_1728 PE=4 SV=1 [Tsukamurella paurometabola]|uniref:Uncharacterized protein n=1 Tax=Tsukamurella paurometabola (strain ATCC 8368 / DSM 20162 / CCUG 35730 / CIP 100753 / JCM 10117 / KCTC 9821 / NBRC 16120 / NCIMB 702349 / NCTC 13040) TaxID=521096 RepID=D5UM66_TSUPD|nr:GNAT family N-acetyltransferase [Tsukamurella paurometabola]ADG78346.1 hypothetical protein Tpau_1728 [Tsukamurella paurometabola DSM 20162]SUP31292.1 Uncharacterised protein [Tsukamurella paurometabola]
MLSPYSGRFRVGDRVVELRAPRLSDAKAWRRTNLEHEDRLRPAFGSPHSDWEAAHSAAEWAHTWLAARSGAGVPLSRVLMVDDGDSDRMVGQQTYAGPDPRTGHAEVSTWIAGLDDSAVIARWMSAMCVLEVLRLNPHLRYITAPLAVTNAPAIALAKASGFTWVQDQRGLREYNGHPIDHTVYALANSLESRSMLAKIVSSFNPEPIRPRRTIAPSPEVLLGLARVGVRRARAGLRPRAVETARLLPTHSAQNGHDIEFTFDPSGYYTVTVDGTQMGQVEVHGDPGTSTTEVIDRLRDEEQPQAAVAALVAACRALADRQDTRRLTLALADRHASATSQLTALGFESEGTALPTRGDEATPRAAWTRYQEQSVGASSGGAHHEDRARPVA